MKYYKVANVQYGVACPSRTNFTKAARRRPAAGRRCSSMFSTPRSRWTPMSAPRKLRGPQRRAIERGDPAGGKGSCRAGRRAGFDRPPDAFPALSRANRRFRPPGGDEAIMTFPIVSLPRVNLEAHAAAVHLHYRRRGVLPRQRRRVRRPRRASPSARNGSGFASSIPISTSIRVMSPTSTAKCS